MSSSILSRALAVPLATQPVERWHVSPLVDIACYHLGWVWVLIPLLLSGPRLPTDFLGLYLLVLTINFLHRHLTMPLVYLDAEIFRRHVARHTVVPVLLVMGFIVTPLVIGSRIPAGFLGPLDAAILAVAAALVVELLAAEGRGLTLRWRTLLASGAPFAGALFLGVFGLWRAAHPVALGLEVVMLLGAWAVLAGDGLGGRGVLGLGMAGGLLAVATAFEVLGDWGRWPQRAVPFSLVFSGVAGIAVAWNIWHTPMQKFGVLRMYAAKQVDCLPEARTPAWVDRLLIWGFVPVIVARVPSFRDEILGAAPTLRVFLRPLFDGLQSFAWLQAPASVFAAASVANFLFWEWKTARLSCWPRMGLGLGLTGLHVALLVNPIKGVVAYAFAHALEYGVFVWAFQRRRYSKPLSHRPLMQRLPTKPWVAVGTYCLGLGALFLLGQASRFQSVDRETLSFLGHSLARWLFFWSVWHSMWHFYVDGFIWKMREMNVRGSL